MESLSTVISMGSGTEDDVFGAPFPAVAVVSGKKKDDSAKSDANLP